MSKEQRPPKYQPRNDYVVIRKIVHGETPSGIALGDQSLEGVEYRVSAVGPKVEDLEVGDKVLCLGQIKQDYDYIPNTKDLLITREHNIVIIFND